MIVDSVFLNAKAILHGEVVDCSLALEEGKISKIGRETHMPHADQKSDLHNQLVLPGLIDEHVHLRDEGREYKEDFTSGTAAAAAGGFTTVLDMPNNDPVTMSAQRLHNRIQLAKRKILVDVGFYSEFPTDHAEIKNIVAEGAVGFKLFMGNQTGGLNVDDDQAVREACKILGELGVPLAVHAEDRAMLMANETKLRQAKKASFVDFLRAHTETVEVAAIRRMLRLSEGTDVRLQFCHVSTQEGVEAIAEAKGAGRTVTCEVTPNHLLLTADDLAQYGGLAIMAPPVRDKPNVDALWRGICDGSVDALGSDHAPHTFEEKTASNVWEIKVGVPGLETTLPLMLTLIRKNRLTFTQLTRLLAEKPAQTFNLKNKGSLKEGNAADLTIVDFSHQYKIDATKFYSKAKFSPYHGWDVNGKVTQTIVAGQTIYQEGQIVAKPGCGSVVRGEGR